MTIQDIEAILAEMLDTYAGMREKYICADASDYHNLGEHDRALANEVCGIRLAAKLVRTHLEPHSGTSLPAYLWHEWEQREREFSARLEVEL
ncbi:hypothetical protein [Nocardia sp. NPDC057440]|uniref:hypothetical protein n=1 Tax=Nocardia sp. NPDC057440 TaxID=3346134 RepID=UPI00366D9863